MYEETANLLRKLIFDWVFYATIADADIGSLKSFHTLIDEYLHHMLVFEQNCMVQTIKNIELFDKKWLAIFDKVLTPFWKTFLWTETNVWCYTINLKTIIFQCSKNYGSPTCVTSLKVAPNMADPIRLY